MGVEFCHMVLDRDSSNGLKLCVTQLKIVFRLMGSQKDISSQKEAQDKDPVSAYLLWSLLLKSTH